MKNHLRNGLLSFALISIISGCSSSDDTETPYTASYLQFYNGSSTSAFTYMRDSDGAELGGVSYADATTLYSLESGDMDVEFYRIDADDKEVNVADLSLNLADGQKSLIILSGNYEQPDFTVHQYTREDLDDHFRVFAISLDSEGASYDLYMSDAGEPFEAATFMANLSYNSLSELAFWGGDSDSEDFDLGDYTLYLTHAGETDVLFESATIGFNYETEYVLALRQSSGGVEGEVEVDMIINSSIVTQYADVDASSQYRIYNSLNEEAVTLTLADNNDISHEEILAANSLSGFTQIDYGDYRLSGMAGTEETLSFNNRLVTLNQGETKAIVVYLDEEGALTSMSFDESNQPQIYDKQIQAVNLVPDYLDIDLYLVRKGETIETAEYRITSIDFGESKSLTLPGDYYELIAVYDSNDDTQVLLDRTELLGLTEDVNYIVTVEPDSTSPTGYKLALLQ